MKNKFLPVMVVHSVTSALRRLRQEDHEFEASLSYTERPYFNKRERMSERGGKREREK
jgi:hypothetical protein